MAKIVVLYGFPESAFKMSIQRLHRLTIMNPKVTFFPIVGPRQLFFIPMIIDRFMFGSSKKIPFVGYISHAINWLALSMPGIFRLSLVVNKKTLDFVKNNMLTEIGARMKLMGLQPLCIDYTPMGLWNLDHTIMAWFNSLGRKFEFDYVIFYESDIFTTKPIDVAYKEYMKLYDACFVDFEIASQNWHFYNFPPGCRRATMRWLKKRLLPATLYRSMFAGALISRRCLERLNELKIDFSGAPYCQNEMRFPTVIAALGFKCGKLNFPFVRYRPECSTNEILSNENAGIFHPVKRLVSAETEYTLKKGKI
jgi:hypothetical protein